MGTRERKENRQPEAATDYFMSNTAADLSELFFFRHAHKLPATKIGRLPIHAPGTSAPNSFLLLLLSPIPPKLGQIVHAAYGGWLVVAFMLPPAPTPKRERKSRAISDPPPSARYTYKRERCYCSFFLLPRRVQSHSKKPPWEGTRA